MFGGSTIHETGEQPVDDLYMFSCTHNTIVSNSYSILTIHSNNSTVSYKIY